MSSIFHTIVVISNNRVQGIPLLVINDQQQAERLFKHTCKAYDQQISNRELNEAVARRSWPVGEGNNQVTVNLVECN